MITVTQPAIKVMHTQFVDAYTASTWADITPLCRSLSITRSLANQANFSLTLVAGEFATSVTTDDLLQFFLSNDGGNTWTTILAPACIISISQSIQYSRGQRQRACVISGTGLEKYFMNQQLLVLEQISDHMQELVMRKVDVFPVATADNLTANLIIDTFVQHYVFAAYKGALADNNKIEHWLTLSLADLGDGEGKYAPRLMGYQDFTNYQGNLWQLMKNYSDPVFNELFFRQAPTAVDREQTEFVLRRRPFMCSDFPTAWEDHCMEHGHLLFSPMSGNIANAQLTQSDNDLYNIWIFTNSGGYVDNKNTLGFCNQDYTLDLATGKNLTTKLPIADPDSIGRKGLRPYQGSTIFMPAHEVGTDFFSQYMAKYAVRLFEWYALNDIFKSGSITVRGGHLVTQPGDAACNIDTSEWFYVEGVTHNWQPGRLSSSFQLTRGITFSGAKELLNTRRQLAYIACEDL